MINFDFLVAGCNTRCRHCYVNGGPGPRMELSDALCCIGQLDAIAACLGEETNFTLDHEPMNHPQILEILTAAAGTKHIQNYHHGMTTGVGLMRRKDKEAVVDRYLACGYDHFGLTIHGGEALHDAITRRSGAYAAAIEAGTFFKARGAQLEVSLMLNRYTPEQAGEITAALDRLQPDWIYAAFPIYTPHRNMADFEPYRATLETAEALRDRLPAWRQDADRLLESARQSSVAFARETLERGTTLVDLFDAPQDERYLCVHPDGRLFYGNSGAETQDLGDLRTADPAAIAAVIRSLPYNRDYDAFYDRSALPKPERLLAALSELPQTLVYGDFPSAIYRGLVACGTPTRILPARSGVMND